MAHHWSLSDAWVFASIEGTSAEDGYRLAEIIARADAIRHLMLSEEEFTRAVPRLVGVGLIGADAGADRYWHTGAGQELYRHRMKRRGAFAWMDVIPPALRELGNPEGGAWVLPSGAFDRAARRYRREAHRVVRDLLE